MRKPYLISTDLGVDRGATSSREITGGDGTVTRHFLRPIIAFSITRTYPGCLGLVSTDELVENHVLRRAQEKGRSELTRLDLLSKQHVPPATQIFDFIEL